MSISDKIWSIKPKLGQIFTNFDLKKKIMSNFDSFDRKNQNFDKKTKMRTKSKKWNCPSDDDSDIDTGSV